MNLEVAMKRKSVVVFFLVLILTYVRAQTQNSFTKGEEFFLRNKPQQALPFLEAAVNEDPANVQAALYLGITYQQLGRFDDGITVLKKILPRAGDQAPIVAFTLGNLYFAKGNAAFAEQFYTQAITQNSMYGSAYLNRANAYVRLGNMLEAITDYEKYLSIEPASPKRPQVEQMIALLRQEIASAEAQKAAQEAAVKAEEERRKKLLEEVAASLQEAAEETRGIQAGAEDVMTYEGEFELK